MPSPKLPASPPGESPVQGPTALHDYRDRVSGDYAATDRLAAVCYRHPASPTRRTACRRGRAVPCGSAGGYVIALDLVDLHNRGKVVHPRSPEHWIRCYERRGMRLEHWRDQEFVPLIRAFRRAAEAVARALGMTSTDPQRSGRSLLEATRSRAVFRLAYGVLWILVQISRPLEHLCELALADRHARHGCFVFRKAV